MELSVDKPSDLMGEIGPGAQYIEPNSPLYGDKETHINLWGQLSFAAIYETVSGEENTLGAIWEATPTDPLTGTGLSDFQVLGSTFLPGWETNANYSIDWQDPYQDISEILASGAFVIVGSCLDTQTGA